MGKPTGLAKEQLRTLDRLRAVPEARLLYLAGGSAVAFHLQHRRSRDLDLFTISGNADLELLTSSLKRHIADVVVMSSTDAAVHLRVDGIPVDVVAYPYQPLEPPSPGPHGFATAGLRDLAAMKLAAIARRGLRRDFWDLHEIVRTGGIDLRTAGNAYLARFGVGEADLYHVLRALTYFDDAERDVVYPAGLGPRRWQAIRAFFTEEAPKLLTVEWNVPRRRRRDRDHRRRSRDGG